MKNNKKLDDVEKLSNHFSKNNEKYQVAIIELPSFVDTSSKERNKAIKELFKSLFFSITKTGSAWVIVDDEYVDGKLLKNSFNTAKELQKAGFFLKNVNIWYNESKENDPRFLKNRYRTIIFVTKEESYTFNLDLEREEHIWKNHEWGGGRRSRYNPKGKNPSNFWIKVKSKNTKIFQYLPLTTKEVLKRCILLSSKKEDRLLIAINDSESIKNVKEEMSISPKIIKLDYSKSGKESVSNHSKDHSKHAKNPVFNKIFNKSSENMMEIKNNSVQLVITSPPYWGLRDYQTDSQIGYSDSYEEYLQRLEVVWKECFRILNNSGSLWVNIGKRIIDHQMLLLADGIIEKAEKIGFVLQDIVIWHKPVTVPTSGKNNFTDRYEHVLFFSKKGQKFFINSKFKNTINDYLDTETSVPLNVWKIHRRIGNIGKKIETRTKEEIIKHTAVYPDDLVKRIIEFFSEKDDLILDPFAGSGTTLSTANKLERKWVGYELNKKYNHLIRLRLKSDIFH